MIEKLIILANELDKLNEIQTADSVDNLAWALKPTIQAHQTGSDDIYLDWLNVPEDQRNKGIGSKLYKEWEAKLSPNIKTIHLHAGNLSGRPSLNFWEHMGFSRVEGQTSAEPYMVKKIN